MRIKQAREEIDPNLTVDCNFVPRPTGNIFLIDSYQGRICKYIIVIQWNCWTGIILLTLNSEINGCCVRCAHSVVSTTRVHSLVIT